MIQQNVMHVSKSCASSASIFIRPPFLDKRALECTHPITIMVTLKKAQTQAIAKSVVQLVTACGGKFDTLDKS